MWKDLQGESEWEEHRPLVQGVMVGEILSLVPWSKMSISMGKLDPLVKDEDNLGQWRWSTHDVSVWGLNLSGFYMVGVPSFRGSPSLSSYLCSCPGLSLSVSPAVPIYNAIVFLFVLANFSMATFMDPGIFPRGKISFSSLGNSSTTFEK